MAMTHDEALARMAEVPGWTLEPGALRKQFVCRDFAGAVRFVQLIVPGADAADHHPDVTINYRRVTLVFTTHSEGGLTAKDFAGARNADAVFTSLTPPV